MLLPDDERMFFIGDFNSCPRDAPAGDRAKTGPYSSSPFIPALKIDNSELIHFSECSLKCSLAPERDILFLSSDLIDWWTPVTTSAWQQIHHIYYEYIKDLMKKYYATVNDAQATSLISQNGLIPKRTDRIFGAPPNVNLLHHFF